MKTKPPQIPPRISGALRGASPLDRFIATGMVILLTAAGKIEEALAASGDASPDMAGTLGGRPLAHWIGKDKTSIQREAGDATREVMDGLKERGVAVPEGEPTDADAAPGGREPPAEPLTFGGLPFEQLAGRSDDDLIKLGDTISPATISEIRGAELAAEHGAKLKIGGHTIRSLNGKSQEEMVALEGIGQAYAHQAAGAVKYLVHAGVIKSK